MINYSIIFSWHNNDSGQARPLLARQWAATLAPNQTHLGERSRWFPAPETGIGLQRPGHESFSGVFTDTKNLRTPLNHLSCLIRIFHVLKRKSRQYHKSYVGVCFKKGEPLAELSIKYTFRSQTTEKWPSFPLLYEIISTAWKLTILFENSNFLVSLVTTEGTFILGNQRTTANNPKHM